MLVLGRYAAYRVFCDRYVRGDGRVTIALHIV
jgi:hypothetical protein